LEVVVLGTASDGIDNIECVFVLDGARNEKRAKGMRKRAGCLYQRHRWNVPYVKMNCHGQQGHVVVPAAGTFCSMFGLIRFQDKPTEAACCGET
jgi:hypothetical protein